MARVFVALDRVPATLARAVAFLALAVLAALFRAGAFWAARLPRPGLLAAFLGVVRFAAFFTFPFFVADFLAIKSCPPENFYHSAPLFLGFYSGLGP